MLLDNYLIMVTCFMLMMNLCVMAIRLFHGLVMIVVRKGFNMCALLVLHISHGSHDFMAILLSL